MNAKGQLTQDVGGGTLEGGQGVLSVLQQLGAHALQGVQVLGQLALKGVNVGLQGGDDASGSRSQGGADVAHVLQGESQAHR